VCVRAARRHSDGLRSVVILMASVKEHEGSFSLFACLVCSELGASEALLGPSWRISVEEGGGPKSRDKPLPEGDERGLEEEAL